MADLPTHTSPYSISTEHLSVHYGGIEALQDITINIERGMRVAVIGPNGAGKSTLFKAIAGTLKPSRGQVRLFDDSLDKHACVAYLPQRSNVDLTFPVSVRDVVLMGRAGRLGPLRWLSKQDRQLATEALEAVDMASFSRRHISELSGGQLQRVFIARAITQNAQIVLMDEPLTGLDVKSQEYIYQILDRLQAQGVTVLVAIHDLHQAANRFEMALLLNRGVVGFGAPKDVFTPQRLQQAYSGKMQLIDTEQGVMLVNHA